MIKIFKNLMSSNNKLTTQEIDEILKFNEEFTKIKVTSKELEKCISATLRESEGPRGVTNNKLIYNPKDNEKPMFLDLNKNISATKIFTQYIENDLKRFESDLRILSHHNNNKYSIQIKPICTGYRLDSFENKKNNIQINNFRKYDFNIVNEKIFGKNKHPGYAEFYAKINKNIRWNYIQFKDLKSEKNFEVYIRSI